MKIPKKLSLTAGLIWGLAAQALANSGDMAFSAVAVTNNIYSVIAPAYGRPTAQNKGWNSNSYFVVTGSGVLVFDTGSSESIGKGIIQAIGAVTDEPVRWVVNSHSHADHWLGNAAFAKLGAEIFASPESLMTMKTDGQDDVDAFYRMTEGAIGSSQIHYPGRILTGNLKRKFGGLEVEFLVANDGHSPGDVMMWLPAQKVIFGGDVLSSDWLPIMTPRGKVTALIATLHSVQNLMPQWVLPGHGQVTSVAAVARDARFLQSVWQQVEKGRQQKLAFESILPQVIQQHSEEYRSQYKDFDASIEYLVEMVYQKQNRAT